MRAEERRAPCSLSRPSPPRLLPRRRGLERFRNASVGARGELPRFGSLGRFCARGRGTGGVPGLAAEPLNAVGTGRVRPAGGCEPLLPASLCHCPPRAHRAAAWSVLSAWVSLFFHPFFFVCLFLIYIFFPLFTFFFTYTEFEENNCPKPTLLSAIALPFASFSSRSPLHAALLGHVSFTSLKLVCSFH